jgi:hypothetical protein
VAFEHWWSGPHRTTLRAFNGIGLTVLAWTCPPQRAVPTYSNMTFGLPELSMTNIP